jgi:hypothetical protein
VAVALGEWLPQPLTHVIPGSAHAPFLSHPTETLDALGKLMESFDAA